MSSKGWASLTAGPSGGISSTLLCSRRVGLLTVPHTLFRAHLAAKRGDPSKKKKLLIQPTLAIFKKSRVKVGRCLDRTRCRCNHNNLRVASSSINQKKQRFQPFFFFFFQHHTLMDDICIRISPRKNPISEMLMIIFFTEEKALFF